MKNVYLVSVDGCGFSACSSLKKAIARVQDWCEGAELDASNSHADVWRYAGDHGAAWIERLPLE